MRVDVNLGAARDADADVARVAGHELAGDVGGAALAAEHLAAHPAVVPPPERRELRGAVVAPDNLNTIFFAKYFHQ